VSRASYRRSGARAGCGPSGTGSGGKRLPHRGAKVTHPEISLREGRNGQVRRMPARLGHDMRALKRGLLPKS